MNVKNEITETQRKLVTQLALLEHTIAELYQAYGVAFTNDRAFWEKNAAEERSHETYMLSMLSFLDKGDLFFNLHEFNWEKIAAVIEEIAAARDTAKGAPGKTTQTQAFEMALHIESSIVDGRFFQYAECDSPVFKTVTHHLYKESSRHLARIRERYLAEYDARLGTPPLSSGRKA